MRRFLRILTIGCVALVLAVPALANSLPCARQQAAGCGTLCTYYVCTNEGATCGVSAGGVFCYCETVRGTDRGIGPGWTDCYCLEGGTGVGSGWVVAALTPPTPGGTTAFSLTSDDDLDFEPYFEVFDGATLDDEGGVTNSNLFNADGDFTGSFTIKLGQGQPDAIPAYVTGGTLQFPSYDLGDGPSGANTLIIGSGIGVWDSIADFFTFSEPVGCTLINSQQPDGAPCSLIPILESAGDGQYLLTARMNLTAVAPATPGTVPELRLDRTTDGDLQVSWDPSECGGAEDYGIYKGSLGSWTSHFPAVCTDSGNDLEETIPIPTDDSYILVVPSGQLGEGSYGTGEFNKQRAASNVACATGQDTTCPGGN